MKYDKEQLKLKKLKIRDDLAALYANSNTWAEFKLNVDLKLPEASKIDLLACKIYYLNNTHPAYFQFFKSMLFIFCVSISIIPITGFLFIGPTIYWVFTIIEIYRLGDVIRRIRDKETLKKMEERWSLK